MDNGADMRRFLRRTYPTLAASANLDVMTLAPGGHVPAEKLDQLRRALVAQGAHTWPNLEWLARERLARQDHGPMWMAGPAGILAEMRRQQDGRLGLARLLPVDTLSDVVSGWWDAATARYAFTTADRRLFMVQGGQVTERALPTEIRRPRVYLPGERTVVLLDDQFEIWTSLDDGASWRPFVHDRKLHVASWAPV